MLVTQDQIVSTLMMVLVVVTQLVTMENVIVVHFVIRLFAKLMQIALRIVAFVLIQIMFHAIIVTVDLLVHSSNVMVVIAETEKGDIVEYKINYFFYLYDKIETCPVKQFWPSVSYY